MLDFGGLSWMDKVWLFTLENQEQRMEAMGVWSRDKASNLKTDATDWSQSWAFIHSDFCRTVASRLDSKPTQRLHQQHAHHIPHQWQ